MRLAGLRVVAITDRRLMVPPAVLATGDWPAVARSFGDAIALAVRGCPPDSVIVQVREKDLDGGPLLQLVRAAQRFAPVIVNDRLDIALAAGARGVHLPERGLAVDDARTVAAAAAASAPAAAAAAGFVVGVSRHAAPGDTAADLVQPARFWATPSKPGATPLGEAALAWPHGAATLVAVGGIDSPDRARQAAAAGASAVALIRAAWTGASLAPFVEAVDAARFR